MSVGAVLTWNGDNVIRNVNAGTVKALIRSGDLVQSTAKSLVRQDSGDLRSSIIKALDKRNLSEKISTNLDYAFAQEFGRGASDYGFTPYMRPAINDNTDKIKKIFIDEESRAIDK